MAILIAACSAAVALPPGKEPPSRLRILPRSEIIKGKDGRAWILGDTTKLLATLNASGPVLLDEGHASVSGSAARAAGWLTDFQLTDEGVDAAVEWTGIGEELFSKRAYRFLSPTLHYDVSGASDTLLGTVRGLHSVGLVNTPNLSGLTALNAQTTPMTEEQLKALTAALTGAISSGLSAIEARLSAAPAAAAVVSAEVPAPNAAAEGYKLAVCTLVDSAVAAGQVAPASKDAYVAMGGETAESFDRLQKLLKGLPLIVAANAKLTPPAADKAALTPEQLKLIKALNITEEQFRAQPGELPV